MVMTVNRFNRYYGYHRPLSRPGGLDKSRQRRFEAVRVGILRQLNNWFRAAAWPKRDSESHLRRLVQMVRAAQNGSVLRPIDRRAGMRPKRRVA